MNFRWVAISALIVFAACGTDQLPTRKRPLDVWVIRSVLDRQPRILTIALDTNCYVAYDVARCTLHKVWKGGIILQGAAYTNQPNLQPVSWGSSYSDTLMNKWKIEVDGKADNFHAINKGYQFRRDRVNLKFAIVTSSNDTVQIEESPEFITDNEGRPGLERKFKTTNVPDGVKVSTTNGKSAFVLKSNGTSQLTTWFNVITHIDGSPKYRSDHTGLNYMEKSDCFTCHEVDRQNVGPSFQQIAARYKSDETIIGKLVAKVQTGGSGEWGNSVMTSHPQLAEGEIRTMLDYIFTLKSDKREEDIENNQTEDAPPAANTSPGDGAPLQGLHPSFDLTTIRKFNFRPRVGGLAFLPDGRLVISTWDSIGGVYLIDNVETGDTNKITVKRFAAGLAEPLGLTVVNGEIYVLQKHELTKLIDHNGDDVADEYASICNSWGVTADFHEFAFGLLFKDGYFYATTSMAMRLMSNEKQLPDRGAVLKIGMDGSYEKVIYGLRQPNGINYGPDNTIFITDNQGQWLPASKLIHVKPGEYHGMRWGHLDTLSEPPPMAMPAIWMPENEVANSPSQPVLVPAGPYKGQMLHGDVTAGGIQRDFIEKINGEYQGCVFRFTQGLETGVNRLCFGKDGALYIGGLGLVGGWSYNGKQWGLQKMKYNGKPAFEMLAIRAVPNGFDIEMTMEVAPDAESQLKKLAIQQWWYKPSPDYGGPKMDVEQLKISKLTISNNRKIIHIELDGLRKNHVIYFHLPKMKSKSGQDIWTTESWYTLNNIPG
ncbi:MAG TPA: c-type cytochrome [Chitinophagaceae bacterium]|nr:c-type cytochrome [Chitinophagaceae bacterium]